MLSSASLQGHRESLGAIGFQLGSEGGPDQRPACGAGPPPPPCAPGEVGVPSGRSCVWGPGLRGLMRAPGAWGQPFPGQAAGCRSPLPGQPSTDGLPASRASPGHCSLVCLAALASTSPSRVPHVQGLEEEAGSPHRGLRRGLRPAGTLPTAAKPPGFGHPVPRLRGLLDSTGPLLRGPHTFPFELVGALHPLPSLPACLPLPGHHHFLPSLGRE